MKQCDIWKFNSLREVAKFVTKFYEIQETFFPDNMVKVSYISPYKNKPGYYIVRLHDKPKFQRKAENEIIDNSEGKIARYDTVSFTKQIRSNQYPDRNSWMRKMKSIKVKAKNHENN